MPKSNAQVTWIRGGAALSLLWSAWALRSRRRLSARLGLRFATAFLESWRELRLEARVTRLLARAGRDLPGGPA